MTKKAIIKKIKSIIKEHGRFTTADVMAETSPCTGSLGHTTQLLEEFDYDKATAICYGAYDVETDTDYIIYEDLKKDVLEEILFLAEQWEVESLQTEKRIS